MNQRRDRAPTPQSRPGRSAPTWHPSSPPSRPWSAGAGGRLLWTSSAVGRVHGGENPPGTRSGRSSERIERRTIQPGGKTHECQSQGNRQPPKCNRQEFKPSPLPALDCVGATSKTNPVLRRRTPVVKHGILNTANIGRRWGCSAPKLDTKECMPTRCSIAVAWLSRSFSPQATTRMLDAMIATSFATVTPVEVESRRSNATSTQRSVRTRPVHFFLRLTSHQQFVRWQWSWATIGSAGIAFGGYQFSNSLTPFAAMASCLTRSSVGRWIPLCEGQGMSRTKQSTLLALSRPLFWTLAPLS